MKRILSFVICLTLMLSVTVCAADVGAPDIFTDVDESSEVGIAILTLYAEGIVQGYGDGTFGVDKNLTRAEFSRMINLVFEFTGTAENKFTDVSESDWFYNDVLTAINAGYIAGFEDNTFRGNENVTRQQACSVVNRIAKLTDDGPEPPIADQVDEWARADVYALINNGYITMEDGGIFRATEDMKRGELALLLVQFIDDSGYTVEIPEDNKPEDSDENNTESSSSGNSGSSGSGSSSGSGGFGGGSVSTGGGSAGSGSGSGSSGSSGSGSGGTENGSGSETPETPEEPETPVDNTLVLESLNKVLSDISGAKFFGNEKKIMNIITTCIEETIAAGESGEEITETYVDDNFPDEVAEVKDIYNNQMTKEERDALINKIAAFDMETLGFLEKYFFN